ncbi:putative oxidoreductase GLYR1 [Trichonephila clavipes]|nr:putative oxidoreductase GLYR1 [Trichonephila clavipes]
MFEVGDLVWVKKTNYPLWPAKISQPPKEKKKRKKSYVCFLGSEACDWVANKKIQHHAEHLIPPNYEKTLFLLKHAIDEIILLSKDKPFKEDTKASPQIVQNLEEEKCMEGKQLMEEEQSPIDRHSYKGDAATLKGKQPSLKELVEEKQPPVKEKQPSLRKPVKEIQPLVEGKQPVKEIQPLVEGKQPEKEKQPPGKQPEKEKQPPVDEKQPSSKEPEKEKQPPVEEKQPSSKEPDKEKQPPVEGKQPEKEKQPHVEEKQSSLKKRVKNYHPLVEQMTLPTKRQQIGKKQPPIKQNQTSINTNPVREKRKHLEQITSRGKVSKKAEKAGDSVKSPRVVQRKLSLSKESVIGETSMIVPCSSKIQKIDEEDSLRSSHNGLSADLSNPKDLKSDDEDAISEASSSSRDWHSGLICRVFNITADDDDPSVSSSSSQQSPRCEIVRRRKDEPKFQNPDSPTVSNELTFSKDDIFIPHREPSPFEDDENEKRLRMKNINPTKKKIGFLGLGKMGQIIVKNLLISRHSVNIWNRTEDKCKVFVEAGAIACKSPAEVVKNSDIIFNCVSDISAVKAILFHSDGVLKGLEDSCTNETIFKGFVEMSTIGYEQSIKIASDINDKGGKYLEACMLGTSANLEKLSIVASGDHYVFEECESCFKAITENARFISAEIGISSKLSKAARMYMGNNVVLAENKSLALEHSLKNQQKDMDLALKMSDDYDQPMYLASAANEIYKRAKGLGYADLDVSAVIQAVKR